MTRGYVLFPCRTAMKELTAITLIYLFVLSSAIGCPAGEKQCEKFELDNINLRRIQKFSGKCCVRNLTFSDVSYLKELLASGVVVDDYPPAVRNEDIKLRVVYDASEGYVLKLNWTYPLCREHARDIEGFNLDLLITGGPYDSQFTRKRMNLTDLPGDKDNYDRLLIEYHFKDYKLVNDTEFIVTITSLPEDNLSSPTNHGRIRGNTRNREDGVTKRNAKEAKDVIVADPTNLLEGNSKLTRVRRSQYPTKLQEEIYNWKPTWSRSITRDNGNLYTVKVYFLQASCEYNFAYYRILLFNCTDDNGSGCSGKQSAEKYYGEDRCSFDDCRMQAYKNTTIPFHNIAPGHYQIYLRTSESRGAQTSMLIYVPVYKPDQPEPLTESPPNLTGNGTTVPVIAETRKKGGSENPKGTIVLAIVAGVSGGAVLIVLVGAIWWCKRKKKRRSNSAHVPILGNSRESSWQSSLGDNNIAPLGRKRVSIINSSDHKQHDLCIDLLVRFLKANCLCDVLWAGIDFKKLRENKSEYVLTTLEDADVIILIHSKGAFEKYPLINDTEEEIEKNEPSLTGDLFPQAMVRLNQLLLEPKSKLINAYFSYTDECYLINRYTKDANVVYQLMRDLHGLYSHIHGISPDDPRIGNINQNDFVTLEYGEILRDTIDSHTRFQRENPNWFEQSHQRKKRTSGDARRNPRNDSLSNNNNNTEQCISGDSGFGEAAAARQHQPGPYYDNPDEKLDNVVAGSSFFPFDEHNGHQFVPPLDLHDDVRPKNTQRNRKRNNLSNEMPLNNAVVSPRQLNTNDRLASVTTNNDNSPTLPLSHRSTGNNGAPATRWGPQPSVHSYPSSRANNASQQNSHAPPSSLPNSSFRSSGPRRSRSSSGRSRNSSGTSDGSNKNNRNAPSMNSNVPTMNSNVPTMHSNGPLLDLSSFPPSSVGSNRARHPSSEAASASVQEPSDFPSIPEDMSFSAPAQSDTSSLNSEVLNQQLMQVNEEFDFNNGGDSGCSSYNDGRDQFYFPKEDRFDQASV